MRRKYLILAVLAAVAFTQIPQATAGPLSLPDTTAASPSCSGGTCCPAVLPCLTLAGTDQTPIQQVQAQLAADIAAYSATAGSLAQVQSEIAALQSRLAVLSVSASQTQAAVQADLAALQAIIGPGPSPTPNPGPSPIVPVVSILAITSSACGPCVVQKKDTLDPMAKAGIPITYLDSGDPKAAAYKVASTPTLIILVNGAEPSIPNTRAVGNLYTAESLTTWYNNFKTWSQAKP